MRALWVALALAAAPDAGTRAVPSRELTQPARVHADTFLGYGKKQEAEWKGHVRVDTGTTRMTCDRLKVEYTADQEVTHMRCDGQVEVVDKDKRALGEHADFDNAKGVLVMTREPSKVEIWNGKTHLRGQKATFFTQEDRLDVSGDVETVIPPAAKDAGR